MFLAKTLESFCASVLTILGELTKWQQPGVMRRCTLPGVGVSMSSPGLHGPLMIVHESSGQLQRRLCMCQPTNLETLDMCSRLRKPGAHCACSDFLGICSWSGVLRLLCLRRDKLLLLGAV